MDPTTEMKELLIQHRLRYKVEVRTILHNVTVFSESLEQAIGHISVPQAVNALFEKFMEEYQLAMKRVGHEFYICPSCEMISYNPNDRINKYCSFCHKFAGDV